MPDPIRVHAIIYSWPAVHISAFAIARELAGHVHKVSVVACTDTPLDHEPGLDVVTLDNSAYFGRQFEKTIEVFDGDVLLQIAADTTTPSWAAVAAQCAARYQANDRLAIWTPDIDGTTWPNSRVFLYGTEDPNLIGVVQTDCIVWAMSRPIVDFLKTMDYARTPLGWGIDWAAIAHAYANNLRVLRDLSVKIHHRIGGSGYDRAEADRQKNHFLSALSDDDKIQLRLMSGVIDNLDRQNSTAAGENLTNQPASGTVARSVAPVGAPIDLAAQARGSTGFNQAFLLEERSEKILAFHLVRMGISRLLDIGSNTGQFAVKMRRYGYTGMIYSVEPQASAYAELVAKAADDLLWIPLLRQGAGDASGYLELNLSENGYSSSLLEVHDNHLMADPATHTVARERIYTNKSSDLLRPESMAGIEALKIDVQGYETKVLEGYEPYLKTVRLLLLEMSLVECYKGAPDLFALDDYLVNKLGFARISLEPSYYDDVHGVVQQYDGIYYRPDQPAQAASALAPLNVGAVLTSIGGAMRRQRSDGSEVGKEWGADCIKSWKPFSNQIFSVSETAPNAEDITWLKAKSKPPIAELFRKIERKTNEHVVLVNADVLLTDALRATLPQLAPDALYYGRRHEVHVDVNQPGVLVTRGYYPQGFDYFIMPPEFVRTVNKQKLIPDVFLVGEPWWDYLVPLLGFVLGFPTKKFGVNQYFGLHYYHEERSTIPQFLLNGERFVAYLKTLQERGFPRARALLDELMAPEPDFRVHLARLTNIICYSLP